MRRALPRLLLLALVLAACLPQRPAPLVKVGLLAPLEGERRVLGYHLLPAARAAMPATVRGQPVEWVILDSGGDPETAARRARELLADPALLAVVGPLLPDEVAAVAPILRAGGVAWWPLAPEGEAGLRAWRLDDESPAWGPTQWPALRRGEIDCYLDPALPDDLGAFAEVAGTPPWPQDWLAWRATVAAAAALDGATALTREAVAAAARPVALPPPARYCSAALAFPGAVQREGDEP